MKAKTILAASFVLISSVIFANGSDDNKLAVVRGQEAGTFKVIFKGEDQASATVNVLDSEGNLVYTKDINSANGFLLPMNFTGLKSGEYTIEVQNGSNTWTKSIYYSRNEKSSTKVEKNSTIQYVHVSKMKNDGKYLLSVMKTGNEVITINVFNANDDLVHSESRKTDGNLSVIYDVKDFSGASKFQITDEAGYSTIIKK